MLQPGWGANSTDIFGKVSVCALENKSEWTYQMGNKFLFCPV